MKDECSRSSHKGDGSQLSVSSSFILHPSSFPRSVSIRSSSDKNATTICPALLHTGRLRSPMPDSLDAIRSLDDLEAVLRAEGLLP